MKILMFLVVFIFACSPAITINYVKTDKGCWKLERGWGIRGVTATAMDCDEVDAILKVYSQAAQEK